MTTMTAAMTTMTAAMTTMTAAMTTNVIDDHATVLPPLHYKYSRPCTVLYLNYAAYCNNVFVCLV